MTWAATIAELSTEDRARLFARLACTAGTTNLGIIDDMQGIGETCAKEKLWFHVDGAYGGSALAAPSARPLFDGIERADSFIVDPATNGCSRPLTAAHSIYADPEDAKARKAHRQHGDYLDVFYDGTTCDSLATDVACMRLRTTTYLARARGNEAGCHAPQLWFSLLALSHGKKPTPTRLKALDCAREAAP